MPVKARGIQNRLVVWRGIWREELVKEEKGITGRL